MIYRLEERRSLINQIRMCRSDLDESTIMFDVGKIENEMSSNYISFNDILKYCIHLAIKGEPMPWESEVK